jgi:hypothetical protein
VTNLELIVVGINVNAEKILNGKWQALFELLEIPVELPECAGTVTGVLVEIANRKPLYFPGQLPPVAALNPYSGDPNAEVRLYQSLGRSIRSDGIAREG